MIHQRNCDIGILSLSLSRHGVGKIAIGGLTIRGRTNLNWKSWHFVRLIPLISMSIHSYH